MIKLAVDSGITDLRTIRDVYNSYAEGGELDENQELIDRINRTSNANFVQRLKDPNRRSIRFRNTDNTATHRMAWSTDNEGAIVYPEVQEIDGELVDMGRPPHSRFAALDSAIEHGDTLRMTTTQAEWFTENYKQYYPNFAEGGHLFWPGGEKYDINGNPIFSPLELALLPTLEDAVVEATPETSRGKYVLAKKNLQAAKEEHKELQKDVKQYLKANGIFRTDEQVQPFVDRINDSASIIGAKQDLERARDAYYSELNNPNGLLPQLYRYWSRHHGYQSKQAEDDFHFGPGADIIDLGQNVQRLTPTSTQSTALFNEFVESKYPSVLTAETYKNSPNRIIGDMAKFPAKNVSVFGGIEDGKFRLDSLRNFNDATTVIPARNIKAGTPMISSIQIGREGSPERSQVYRDWDKIDELRNLRENSLVNEGNLLREYWSDPGVQEGIVQEIHELNEGNKYLRGLLESGNNSGPQHRHYIRQRIRSNKRDIRRLMSVAEGKMPNYFLFDLLAQKPNLAKRYPRPMSEIQTSQYFQDAEPVAYTFTDTEGNKHFVSEYNASVLDGKTVIGNPNGSVFIGKLQDISRPQLDSLNAYLKDNPSWIMRTDLGSFDQYRLDNPSLETYLKQYFEHPKANDPNVYAVGTTEPNKLWNKANGGPIYIKKKTHDMLDGSEKVFGHSFNMGGRERRKKTLMAELPEVVVTPQYLSYWDAAPEQTRGLTNKNGKYNTTSTGDKGYTHFDTISARYKGLNAAMQRANFSDEEMSRLSPFLLTQLALEGGWVVDRPDNNFGGMMSGEKRIEFDTEDSFYDAYLKNLDAKWGDDYLGKGKGWRNAKTINEYADIINREDLGLHTKEAFDEYNRKHRDHPAYIYTPLWKNNNTGLMDENKFGGIYDRALGNYELLMKRMGEWDKFARNNKIFAK